MERLASKYIFDPELTEGKMVFLIGPRQVGKTTLARQWLAASGSDLYFNFDDPAVFLEYKKNPLYFKNLIDALYQKTPVAVVFDEIHKYRNWRNILKGLYDVNRDKMSLLVTGSARLDHFRRSGDSLVGRYFSFHLFPVILPEAVGNFHHVLWEPSEITEGEKFLARIRNIEGDQSGKKLKELMMFGGFPEPLVKASPRFHRRWRKEYETLLTKEDVRDLSKITDLKGIEHLVKLLPERVGAPLSINSLREDLGVHFQTAANWIETLKKIFLVFTISPWHNRSLAVVRKEPKLYFYDWSMIPQGGPRFENLVAVALSGLAARWTEVGLGDFEIFYIREKGGGKEVDFLLANGKIPLALIEAKTGDSGISPAGRYYAAKLNIPFYQIVLDHEVPAEYPGKCFIIPAESFLMTIG